MSLVYPSTKKVEQIDDYHGTKVSDPFQWLEDYSDKEVKEWVNKQEDLTHSLIDKLPQKKNIQKRLNELWRYDERTVPWEVLKGKRIFFSERKKEDEKWVYYTQEDEHAEKTELLNPNDWPEEETLSFTVPSVDGTYLAFGKDKGGEENSKIYLMEVATKKILNDSVTGWKQGRVVWLHDNSGFYYSRKPVKGQVPDGEEYYWDEVYFHQLGTEPSQDKKIFFCEEEKEYYHSTSISEDGQYIIFYRSTFGKGEVFFKHISSEEIIPLAQGFDAQYFVNIINGKIIIWTDLKAPNGKIMITDVDKPQREHWKEFVSESEDKLSSFSAVSGHLYLNYLHKAHSKVKIYTLQGTYVKDLKFPGIGSGGAYGYFSKKNIWVVFSSFLEPRSTYQYDFEKNELELFFRPPINMESDKFETEQVTYPSKDGTLITMFLLKKKGIKKDGNNPVFLTGYGGFNTSMTPSFSSTDVIWLEAGGMIAIPNLRGGGEYGRQWHKAGTLERKQNVFDDFIAAAEWLIKEKYTTSEKLAISGGSNGGLLVGAVTVQRPELFKVVACAVPLLDMLRYHQLSIANTWAVEYGSSQDPEQFKYLYKYSPYHNIKEKVKYPAMLITTSENDSRVDPMHALKMIARLQEVDPKGEPHLLLVRKSSGHGGGTTISKRIKQIAEEKAFLMKELEMKY